MSTDSGMEFIVYRKSNTIDSQEVIAMSRGVSAQDANLWRGLVTLAPLPGKTGASSESAGIFAGPDQDFIMGRAIFEDAESATALYQHTHLSADVYRTISGNLRALLEHTTISLDQIKDDSDLDPLEPPPLPTWTADRRQTLLMRMESATGINIPVLIHLLAAALDQRKLLVAQFPPDLWARIDLAEAIALLLPSSVCTALTFSSNVETGKNARGRIVFCDNSDDESGRWIVNLDAERMPDDSIRQTPYIQLLESLWNNADDITGFVRELRSIDHLAGHLMQGKTLSEGLVALANRHTLNLRVMAGEETSPADIQNALASDSPPEGHLRDRYLQKLLVYALAEREPDAVDLVLHYMQEHEEVERLILEELRQVLEEVPDDVYYFLRTSMSDKIDEDRLPILQDSAKMALRVALEDSDNETLLSWLNLIAREPAEYELGETLRDGVLAAQKRAHKDGELGSGLLVFVARRTPDMIDRLLEDDLLIAQSADPLGTALREFDREAASAVFETGREISLVLFRLAVDAAPDDERAIHFFDSTVIDYLWNIYHNGNNNTLPDKYQAAALITDLIDAANDWLPQTAVFALLDNVIASQDLDLLPALCPQVKGIDGLPEQVILSCENNQTPADTVLEIMGMLLEQNTVSEQEAVNILVQMAEDKEWGELSRPLVERANRILMQNPELSVPIDTLWHLLELASGETKMESVASMVTRRLLQVAEGLEDEAEIIDLLMRIQALLEWSKSLRAYLMSWWRDNIHAQPLARLQQLERALEGKKELAAERVALQTTLAIRRMLGQRSLQEFSEAVTTSYNLLQAISESFDPSNKQLTTFDPLSIKTELELHAGDMTPDERRVLAKNLKEMAQLIVAMSDLRTKPAIMRREEDVERQLVAGDQEPQSALDTMRWLSGHLDGLQGDTEEAED